MNAALKTFFNTGYLGTKITAIAAEAGVSHGLIHHYYASKAQLYHAALQSGFTYMEEVRNLSLASSEEPEQQLRQWVYSITHDLGQTNAYLFYNRLIMQVLGAPDMHPQECIQALNRFTESEITTWMQVLMKLGQSQEVALKHMCVTFNVLIGSHMMGTYRPDYLMILYETGCRLLGIPADPIPTPLTLPPLPWDIDNEGND